jgi:hypothetical protein
VPETVAIGVKLTPSVERLISTPVALGALFVQVRSISLAELGVAIRFVGVAYANVLAVTAGKLGGENWLALLIDSTV